MNLPKDTPLYIEVPLRIQIAQYENLRRHFNQLVENILGPSYYNLGQDVYSADQFCCEDIYRAYLEQKNKTWIERIFEKKESVK